MVGALESRMKSGSTKQTALAEVKFIQYMYVVTSCHVFPHPKEICVAMQNPTSDTKCNGAFFARCYMQVDLGTLMAISLDG